MKFTWLFVIVIVAAVRHSIASVRLTNLRCEEYHPEFATFLKCRLKVIRRGVISLNVNVKLFQVPVNNVTANLSMFKKLSGYRPFLNNVTFDFCKFMLNRKHVPVANIFFNVFASDSNINHTCPYDHNIIVDNFVVYENHFKYFPLPRGDYMFQLKFAAYNDWKASVQAYVEVTHDF
uniref:MD-2-related lipid-recognition domain-containing protein n=1 Tax=Stomoxys calcitrans TaxID=35570 RepID=A0A1I8QD64_STOCA